MSHDEAFLAEKLKIDDLVERGYTITSVQGTLDGDVVEFEHKTLKSDKETILFTNPDSRKYFATLYIKQQQKAEGVK